jgi:8-oxo-dGTP pyrophosphatase MutT (NUDIX family)
MRELAEETGYTAAEWAYGGEIHNAAAYSTESIWIWFARGLVAGAKRPDAGEFVETHCLSEAELDAAGPARPAARREDRSSACTGCSVPRRPRPWTWHERQTPADPAPGL